MTRPARLETPFIQPAALAAWDRFGRVLSDLTGQGRSTPCAADPGPFVSDHSTERREAARACHGCPALAACAAYADTQPERWHVWAGTDRTPTTKGTR